VPHMQGPLLTIRGSAILEGNLEEEGESVRQRFTAVLIDISKKKTDSSENMLRLERIQIFVNRRKNIMKG